MRSNQQVEVIKESYDDRGRGNFDAGDRLAKWLEDHWDMRVVALAGDGHQVIAVVGPVAMTSPPT